MSFNWLIVVNWAVIMNTQTKKKWVVVVVTWVCFTTFQNWWTEGRAWLKGYIKGGYYRKVGAASADDVDVAVEVTFLSLHLAVWKSNQEPHAIDATLRLRLLDGAEILRHRRDLTHCLIPGARALRLTEEVGADAQTSTGGGARRPDGARLHHRGRVRHPVLGPARVVRCSVVLRHLLVVDIDVSGLPRCVVRARRTNKTFTTAAVPSRHRRASSPSSDEVGGFIFDFEAIRTASSELDTSAREATRDLTRPSVDFHTGGAAAHPGPSRN